MIVIVKKISAIALAIAIMVLPRVADAGFASFVERASTWWKANSIGVHTMDGDDETVPAGEDGSDEEEDEQPEGENGSDEDAADEEEVPSSGGTPGMCLVPQELPKTECAIGSGFLCVSTPSGGVSGSQMVMTGTIDVKSSTLASIQIVAQNDYTKGMSSVDTSSPSTAGCTEGGSFQRPFCLDSEGHFAARVDLEENGPYTISVSASRLSGSSASKQVHTSRVIATKLDSSSVSFNPDISNGQFLDNSHVTVTVDLLGECQFCDFIGASTGGVTVTVENIIKDADGVERRVSCATTMEQGGQGRFMLGVPAGTGQNSLTVKACNAAADGVQCPTLSGFSFGASGVVDASDAVEFLSPEPRPSYDKDEFPSLPWKFKLAGSNSCVSVRLNRESAVELCPDSGGVYSMEIQPREGINVVSLATGSGMEEFAWAFGWGKIASPHVSGDGAIDIQSAVEAGITSKTLKDMLLPAMNNYLTSDEFETLLDDMLSGTGQGDLNDGEDEELALDIIPKCSSGGGGDFTTELRGKPKIGMASLKSLELDDDEMGLTAVIRDVEVGLDLIPKKDLPPLPLVISFRKAVLDVELISDVVENGAPRILISSPHSDCDYKSGTYCKHMPAPLIPKNIVGGANSYGSFLKCDMSLAKGKAKEACSAINSLNAQTGILSETVLDALNEALYCSGSVAMTKAVRNGVDIEPLVFGCAVRGGCSGAGSIIPAVRIPLGILIDDGLEISEKGLKLDAGLSFGDTQTYSTTLQETQIDSAGIILGKGIGESALGAPGGFGGDMNVAISLDAVNAFLFTAIAQGDGRKTRGMLDMDVHESFFKGLEFDFVKECDEYEIPKGGEDETPMLCNVRPRVSTLLGSALTTYGYLEGNHPLMMAVRGNRALGPRISVADVDDLPVIVQGEGEGEAMPTGSLLAIDVGGLQLDFYALETDEVAGEDEYGNPTLVLDENGNPKILSMRPDDSDPWNGAIISFDLTLLLGVEIGSIETDPDDAENFVLRLGILGDRTRLVLTPMPGSNATTVPSAGLVSSLSQKLKLAVAALEGFDVPIPREIALKANEDGVFGMLGLAKIGFGDDGLSLDFDAELNKVKLAVSAMLTQILHHGGDETVYDLP